MQPLSLYVHIPFCRHKCHYCDFNTYAGLDHLIPPYLAALEQELDNWAGLLTQWEVRTIFFGGGTPSLLSPEQVEGFLARCRARLTVTPDAEVTMEANPGTVTLESLERYRRAGVNRLSYGAQSFQPAELTWLGRQHSVGDIEDAVRKARTAGFQRLNLDLIYGLPEQPLASWEASLLQTLALQVDHLSLYALTIEEGTPLGKWVAQGTVPLPDPDLAADQYLAADAALTADGYHQYEISNWAAPGQECLHNLTYWRNLTYVGLGAGAHSCFGGYRFSDILLPQEYIEQLSGHTDYGEARAAGDSDNTEAAIRYASPIADLYPVDDGMALDDSLILGLRLNEGMRFDAIQARHGVDMRDRYRDVLKELVEIGLLEQNETLMRLTPRGRLLANEVFVRLLNH